MPNRNKYRMTRKSRTIVDRHGNKHKLRQIVATMDFGCVRAGDFGFVRAGELGGWIEHYGNLRSYSAAAGGLYPCWVFDDACVFGTSVISDNAKVRDNAIIENSYVKANARVIGEVTVQSSKIEDYAFIYHKARIVDSTVIGSAEISDSAIVKDSVIANNCVVSGSAVITNCRFSGDVSVSGKAQLTGMTLSANMHLSADVVLTKPPIYIQLGSSCDDGCYYDITAYDKWVQVGCTLATWDEWENKSPRKYRKMFKDKKTLDTYVSTIKYVISLAKERWREAEQRNVRARKQSTK